MSANFDEEGKVRFLSQKVLEDTKSLVDIHNSFTEDTSMFQSIIKELFEIMNAKAAQVKLVKQRAIGFSILTQKEVHNRESLKVQLQTEARKIRNATNYWKQEWQRFEFMQDQVINQLSEVADQE